MQGGEKQLPQQLPRLAERDFTDLADSFDVLRCWLVGDKTDQCNLVMIMGHRARLGVSAGSRALIHGWNIQAILSSPVTRWEQSRDAVLIALANFSDDKNRD